MSEAAITVLIFMPVLVAAVATLVLRKKIQRPILFAVASAFSLLGLQAVISPAAVALLFRGASSVGAHEAGVLFNQGVVSSAVLVVLIGVPFVLWLSRAFRNRAG